MVHWHSEYIAIGLLTTTWHWNWPQFNQVKEVNSTASVHWSLTVCCNEIFSSQHVTSVYCNLKRMHFKQWMMKKWLCGWSKLVSETCKFDSIGWNIFLAMYVRRKVFFTVSLWSQYLYVIREIYHSTLQKDQMIRTFAIYQKFLTLEIVWWAIRKFTFSIIQPISVKINGKYIYRKI